MEIKNKEFYDMDWNKYDENNKNHVSMDESKIYKFCVVGDCKVGKSQILSRYAYDDFNIGYNPSNGVNFQIKKFIIDNTKIKVTLWDLSGDEKYQHLTRSYYKNSHVFLLVYDITKKETFNNAKKWISEYKNKNNNATFIVLVGNKSDLNKSRQVSKIETQEYALNNGLLFCEMSALNNDNVAYVFEYLINELVVRDFPKLSNVELANKILKLKCEKDKKNIELESEKNITIKKLHKIVNKYISNLDKNILEYNETIDKEIKKYEDKLFDS